MPQEKLHQDKVIKKFREGVKKQQNGGDPYWPDWDAVEKILLQVHQEAYNQGKKDGYSELEKIKSIDVSFKEASILLNETFELFKNTREKIEAILQALKKEK